MGRQNDREGVRRVRHDLASDHTRRLLVRTARRVVPAEESEDAAYDAVVQALVHADQFREDAQVSTWLHRIAFNAALAKQRGAKRATQRLQRQQSDAGALTTAALGPSELEAIEQRDRLRAAVARLPEVYRTAVERCVYEERNAEAVAAELGITPSALRTRITRARDRLRSLMIDPLDTGADVNVNVRPDRAA